MSIITISKGSYSRGGEVAEKLAKKLDYECISRIILLEASEQFNIPSIKLVRAIHDAPSFLDRLTYGKERYVAYIRAALLNHLQKGNVVYHGLAGHFFLQGVPNVLRVRIIANFEKRVAKEMKQEKISAEKASRILKKDDKERRRWSQHLYGIDTWDPSLYDVVLNIATLTVEDAVDIIVHTAKLPCFQMTPESQEILANVALAAQVQAALVKSYPKIDVCAENGVIYVSAEGPLIQEKRIRSELNKSAQKIAGVKEVKVLFETTITPG
ncbi:MAG: cytidylate kinase-like family protein [Syntrophobacteria bacterium]